jgi:acyl-CoA synthetase (AMP-forming)/AMP-acid ligase II
MFLRTGSSRPLDRSVQNWNANHPFLVDSKSVSTATITYGQLFRDLDSFVNDHDSLQLFDPSKRQRLSDATLYGYLIRLFAAISKGESLTLNDLSPLDIRNDSTNNNVTRSSGPQSLEEQSAQLLPDRIANLTDRILKSKSRITLFTSGTTGTPKPIHQTVANLTRTVQISDKHHEDVWGLAYQPTKIAALQVLLQAICNGNTIVNLFGLPIVETREQIRACRISHLSATPTYLRLIAADSCPFPMVRAVTVGGEVCDAGLLSKLKTLFPNARFRNVYASSEMGTLLHSSDDCFVVPDSIRNSVLIRDGRLWIHQSLIAENLQDHCIDGFWDSGDEVQIVDENPLRLKVSGRRTDWINVGGTKVNPHDVEMLLRAIPGVIDARVFGIANSVTGQLVAAELSKDGSTELDVGTIRKRMQEVLPAVAVPRVITLRDANRATDTLKKERLQ